MRIAVIGSRRFADAALVARVMADYRDRITLLVSGGAAGADTLGAEWAEAAGVPTRIFLPATRDRTGFFARNRRIVEAAELVIAFWDGRSTGTAHTLDQARRRGVPVRVIRIPAAASPLAASAGQSA